MTTSDLAPIQIAAFYHFQTVPGERINTLKSELEAIGDKHAIRGLVIFATEGINGTIAAETRDHVVSWLDEAAQLLGFPRLNPKWSEAAEWPFRKFAVKIRDEIVSLGKPEVQPLAPHSVTHLPPTEWNRMMEEEDCVVLDTRNWYETRIGKFKGAIDPNLSEFHEWSDYLKQSEIPKEKNVLIYCTGGIRCEKAIVEMHNQGFKNVFQLDGGILNYLEQYPNRNFEGECFVFDTRVAVDQNLEPSQQYKLCPHCGQPADQQIQCIRCDTETMICVTCRGTEYLRTCSKNCSNHWQVQPGKKGRNQGSAYRHLNTARRHSLLRPLESPRKRS
jgi:UPF0176 protein